MNTKLWPLLLQACLLTVSFTRAFSAETVAPPEEVKKLAGTYTGSWTMSGIDKAGEPVALMRWSDVMTAEKPTVENGRAFVTTMDEMTFEGRPGAPVRLPGKEGYVLKPGGGVGDYFIESAGQSFRPVKLSDSVWSYTTPAAPQDLARLGFPSGAKAQHVVVKIIEEDHGVELHRVTRLTTATWTDGAGRERTLQFISLQGVHRRKT